MDIIATGVDVGKDALDVSVAGGRPFRVENSAEGAAALASALPPGSVVALERSGGYEREAVRALRGAGHEVRVLNPLAVRRLAQAMGRKAKTDALDARTLASAAVLPAPRLKSEDREALCAHARHCARLAADLAKVKKRLGLPGLDPLVAASLDREKAFLDGELKAMRASLEERALSGPSGADVALAVSVPGVGKATACAVVAELPDDLSGLTPAQIAGYAGLAPLDDSSGRRKGPKTLGRGNKRLKAALYMPAFRAAFKDDWAQGLYTRLKAKGKSHQSAVVAVMRRLLLRIVAVLKRRTPWQKETPVN